MAWWGGGGLGLRGAGGERVYMNVPVHIYIYMRACGERGELRRGGGGGGECT